MFCTKCGKKLEEDAIFCVACGNRIEREDLSEKPEVKPAKEAAEQPAGELQEEVVEIKAEETEKLRQPETVISEVSQPKAETAEPKPPKEKKKISKKVVALLIVIVAVVFVLIIGISIWNRPVAKINRALQARETRLALDVLAENNYAVELNEKTDELIIEIVDETAAGYNDGTLTFDEANGTFSYLFQLGYAARETYDHLYAVSEEVNEKYYLERDLSEAKDTLNSGDSYTAMQEYNEILSEHGGNQEALEGYEQAQQDYLNEFITSAWQYAAEGDYENAQWVLDDAVTALGEKAEIQKARDEIEEQRVSGMLDEVYAFADSGNWETALDLLDTYEEENPGEKIFHDTRAEIMAKMPITLKNIITISSDHVEVEEDVIYDRYGNYYDGAVLIGKNYDTGYGLFNLNKKYVKFTGTVFVHKSVSNGRDASFSIYLDDELVYTSGSLTEESAPVSLELDVTNISTMRITTDADHYGSDATICFGNTSFEKVPVAGQ